MTTPPTPPGKPSDNTGKMMTRRVYTADRCTVILTYSTAQAIRLRTLAQAIQLKGDRKPSLSLLARRSMALYLDRMEQARAAQPEVFAAEIAQLEDMVTYTAQPASKSKRRAA